MDVINKVQPVDTENIKFPTSIFNFSTTEKKMGVSAGFRRKLLPHSEERST